MFFAILKVYHETRFFGKMRDAWQAGCYEINCWSDVASSESTFRTFFRPSTSDFRIVISPEAPP